LLRSIWKHQGLQIAVGGIQQQQVQCAGGQHCYGVDGVTALTAFACALNLLIS
jgi:hypothetical protein